MSQVVFQNIRKPCSGETDVAVRSEMYYCTCICLFIRFSCFHSFCVRCCDTQPIYSLWPLSGIDEMNADHLKLLDCEVVLLRLQPLPQVFIKRSNALH